MEIAQVHGMTALMYASYLGDSVVVEALIDAGATVDCADCRGLTAAHFALLKQHAVVAQMLCNAHYKPVALIDASEAPAQLSRPASPAPIESPALPTPLAAQVVV